ncbi:MAG: EamA family transporter, partial [Bacteroidota bacterium]
MAAEVSGSHQHPALVRILLLITVAVWGSTFVATKLCLAYLTPAEVLGLQLLLATPVLYGLILFKEINLNFTTHERRRL